MSKNLPKYIIIQSKTGDMRTALRLSDEKESYYWRDCGGWGIPVTCKNGKIVLKPDSRLSEHLKDFEVSECSEEEYLDDNGLPRPAFKFDVFDRDGCMTYGKNAVSDLLAMSKNLIEPERAKAFFNIGFLLGLGIADERQKQLNEMACDYSCGCIRGDLK